MAQYILSDPNFSDGTRREVIEQIVNPFRDRSGVKLIGYEPDPDFDRLPIEAIGRPEPMKEALLAAAGKAYELIDMEKQRRAHPRVGAVDTIESYPARDMTIDECREFAHALGNELFNRYAVPTYFTGNTAPKPEHEGLTYIRTRNYDGLKEAVLQDPARAPDRRPAKLHPTGAATIVDAVEEHDACFNLVLGTTDLAIGKNLAGHLRGKTG